MDATALGLAAGAACLGLAASGSALGAGWAGMAACGAWKKLYAQDKPVPFVMFAFVGAPLTQTIYGFILMTQIIATAQALAQANASLSYYVLLIFAGLFSGLGIGVSAAYQGAAGAAAADAFGETPKGFGNYIIVLGILESVAIFVLIFMLITLTGLPT